MSVHGYAALLLLGWGRRYQRQTTAFVPWRPRGAT
jgi:hypothetical protein